VISSERGSDQYPQQQQQPPRYQQFPQQQQYRQQGQQNPRRGGQFRGNGYAPRGRGGYRDQLRSFRDNVSQQHQMQGRADYNKEGYYEDEGKQYGESN